LKHAEYIRLFRVGMHTPPDVKKLAARGDVEGLFEALAWRKDGDVRVEAVWALGRIGDERSVEPLLKAAEDEEVPVRIAVLMVLGKIGDVRVDGTLLACLKHRDWRIRLAAARGLGERRGSLYVEALVELLNDREEQVREGVAETPKQIGDANNVRSLITALTGSEPRARYLNMGKLGDERPVGPLITENCWVTMNLTCQG
jgi:HEAT repeat protein